MDDKTNVDHDAINATIHKWMRKSPSIMVPRKPGLNFSRCYNWLSSLQDRCDELGWRLNYRRVVQNAIGESARFFAAMSLPVGDSTTQRRFLEWSADTLPLAICLAVVAAIEKLEQKPEQRLITNYGSDGFVQVVMDDDSRVNTIAIRGIREEEGGDGIQFCCGRSVHITDPGQIRDIAKWLNVMAKDMDPDQPKESEHATEELVSQITSCQFVRPMEEKDEDG